MWKQKGVTIIKLDGEVGRAVVWFEEVRPSVLIDSNYRDKRVIKLDVVRSFDGTFIYICGIERKRTGKGSLSLSVCVALWLELSEPWSVDCSIKDKGTDSGELYVLDCMVLD